MKNSKTCPNCTTQNPEYALQCSQCSFVLNTRVPVIDFWSAFSGVIESPSETFISIIRAEHKNYILFILPFVAFKLSLLASLFIIHYYGVLLPFSSVLTGLLAFPVLFLLVCFVLTQIAKITSLKPRNRDIIAVLSYAMTPIAISAVLLSILEIAVFGISLFELSPSPFFLKPLFAWFFVLLEIAMVIWAMVMAGKALNHYFPRTVAYLLSLLVIGIVAGIAVIINPYLFS